MFKFINRVFDLREGETGVVIVLSLLLLANTTSRQMSGVVGIADFINFGGLNQTLVINLINGVLILITATLSSFVIDRFNRIQLLRWTSFVFALSFISLALMSYVNVSSKVMAALLYLLSQQQWLVFPMMFWVLVNDMFEMAQGKRLIPIIGSWTFIGKILGIGIAIMPRFLSDWGILKVATLTIEMVVMTNVLIYLLIFALISIGLNKVDLRKTVQQPQTIAENLSEGVQFVREVPMFRYLLLSIMAIGICDIVVEFRFFVVAKSVITDGAEYKQFYSYYLMAAAWASFFFQGFVTGRIIQKIDLKNSFLVQPFIALGVTLAMIASSGMWINTLASLGLKISRNTIDESTGKAFQSLIPEERRGRVALFINNYIPAVGYILGSILAGVIVYLGITFSFEAYSYVYLVMTAFAAAIAIFAIFKMRTLYDSSMFNWRLKRRKRGVDLLKKFEEI